MTVNETYLSIAEFAERAGVSKQAVYKRLDKGLKPYVKEINGIKCISLSAIGLYQQPTEPTVEPTEQPHKPTVESADSIKYLLAQLEEKDKLIHQQQATIDSQNSQIRDLQNHIIEQGKELTEIVKKQSQQQENFQILLAQQQAKSIEKTSHSTQPTVEQPVEQQVENEVEPCAEQPKKKSFWQRIFGDQLKFHSILQLISRKDKQ